MKDVSELGRELGRMLRESAASLRTSKREKIEEYKRELARGETEVREKINKVIKALQLADRMVRNKSYSDAAEIIEDIERTMILRDIKTNLYSMDMLEDEIFHLESKLK